jgi:hypothetical protein
MSINPALLGHGVFSEGSINVILGRYANYQSPGGGQPHDNIDRLISALKDMHVSTVWIQLFSRSGEFDTNHENLRTSLIARLTQAGILWAGWGYCAGVNAQRDLGILAGLKTKLGMTAFVIDAEPGNKVIPNPADHANPLPDLWKIADFNTFVDGVVTMFGKDNVAVSTWPVLQLQDTATNPVIQLMKNAAARVCAFAPQAYWMTFPNHHHYNAGFDQAKYPPNDPSSYVRLVIDSWSKLGITSPLIISGQAYWGEGGPLQAPMDAKAASFIATFSDWNKIIGFNWYHGGGNNSAAEGSMSDPMIHAIAATDLSAKPYKPG